MYFVEYTQCSSLVTKAVEQSKNDFSAFAKTQQRTAFFRQVWPNLNLPRS